MPAPVLVREILDQSAALLNDTGKQIYTYAAQTPLFKLAYNELEELLQQNGISITNETTSPNFTIPVGTIDIGGPTGPALPLDLIEIYQMFERTSGSSESFVPMTRQDFLPSPVVATTTLSFWQFNDQYVKFISVGATSIREVKMNYVAANFPTIVDEQTNVPAFNSKTFLAYRTAGLCAYYIGENESRAGNLNAECQLAVERLLAINIKAYQSMPARRLPFRARWKARGWM